METWIRRAGKGDAEAFIRAMEPCEADMYRMALVHVKRPEDALDVVQEAACRAFRSIGKLRHEEYFKTWLLRIVINCARDHLKKTGREQVTDPDMLQSVLTEEDDAENVIRKIGLETMLNALDPEERTAVALKYHYGYSFPEMAHLMDRPVGTVKTILYRALKKLRAGMEEEK